MKRSQAALEFLTTYAWAFVAIAIVIGALYYSGILDFSKYIPQKCTFPLQFKCLDFSLRPTQINVKAVNNLGEDIKITYVEITDDSSTPLTCTPPATPFDWAYSTETNLVFTGCSGGSYFEGGRVNARVTMSYFAVRTLSQPRHSIVGKINGKVTS